MLYESQDHLWKHVLCHTHQLSWSTRSPSSCIRSMLTTIKIKFEHYYYHFSHPATNCDPALAIAMADVAAPKASLNPKESSL